MKRMLPVLTLALAFAGQSASAAEWSDNSIHYWYGTQFKEPGTNNGGDISKDILTFTHVSGWKYGGNFFTVDFLKSSSKDPAAGSVQGAMEAYAVYRGDISLSKVTGTSLAFGPLRDISLEFGADYGTKNTAFAPNKTMPVLGLSFALNVPGFWNVAVLAEKEWNNNGLGFVTKHSVAFDPTVMLATSWGIPIGTLPLSFSGFGSVNPPKGKDAGGAKTKTEVLVHPKLMLDVASFFGSKGVEVGGGYQYWLNKFGNDHALLPGCKESAFFVEAAVHL